MFARPVFSFEISPDVAAVLLASLLAQHQSPNMSAHLLSCSTEYNGRVFHNVKVILRETEDFVRDSLSAPGRVTCLQDKGLKKETEYASCRLSSQFSAYHPAGLATRRTR